MRTLDKRIAALEQIAAARQRTIEEAIERAIERAFDVFGSLTESSDLELLLASFGAESDGRPLTESELRVRRTYEQSLKESLKRECRQAKVPIPAQLDHTRYIKGAMIRVMASQACTTELMLAASGMQAEAAGETPSEAEYAARRTVGAKCDRFAQLAIGSRRSQELR